MAMRPGRLSMKCSRNRRRSMLPRGRSGRAPDRNIGRRCPAVEERDGGRLLDLQQLGRLGRDCTSADPDRRAQPDKKKSKKSRAFSPIRWRYAITSSARRGSNQGARRRRGRLRPAQFQRVHRTTLSPDSASGSGRPADSDPASVHSTNFIRQPVERGNRL